MRLHRTLVLLTLAACTGYTAADNGPKLRASRAVEVGAAGQAAVLEAMEAVHNKPDGPIREAALSKLEASLRDSEVDKLAELNSEATTPCATDTQQAAPIKAMNADERAGGNAPANPRAARQQNGATGLEQAGQDLLNMAGKLSKASQDHIKNRAQGTGGPLESVIYDGVKRAREKQQREQRGPLPTQQKFMDAADAANPLPDGIQGLAKLSGLGPYQEQVSKQWQQWGEGRGLSAQETEQLVAHLLQTDKASYRVGSLPLEGSLAQELAQAIAIMKQRQRDQEEQRQGQGQQRSLGALEDLTRVAGASGGAHGVVNGVRSGDLPIDFSLAEELAQAIAIMKQRQRDEAEQRQREKEQHQRLRALGAEQLAHLAGVSGGAQRMVNRAVGGSEAVDSSLAEELAQAIMISKQREADAASQKDLARPKVGVLAGVDDLARFAGSSEGTQTLLSGLRNGALTIDSPLVDELAQAILIMKQRKDEGQKRGLAGVGDLTHLAGVSGGAQRIVGGAVGGSEAVDSSLAEELAQVIIIMKQRQKDGAAAGQYHRRGLGALEDLTRFAGSSGGMQRSIKGGVNGEDVLDGSLAEELAQAIAIMKQKQKDEAAQGQGQH